ncbi:MAG: AraC family transcriptional regulator [Lentisphaeria bacterium]|jgi:AraC-like DNA-binding protein
MKFITPAEIQPQVRHFNHFAPIPNVAWGPRTIPDLELILVLAGEFSYAEPGTPPVLARPGDVLCLRPNREHVVRQLGAGGVISCLHCDLLPGLSWGNGDYRLAPEPQLLTHAGDDPLLPELFRGGATAHSGYGRNRAPLAQTLARAIWLRLAEQWQGGAAAGTLSPSPRLDRMLQYIRAHLHEPLSRQALARAFALTPQYINALFRRELGIPPTQLIRRERVLKAHHLILNEGLTLKAAAQRTGFRDVFYFSRVFKRVMGIPPGKVR